MTLRLDDLRLGQTYQVTLEPSGFTGRFERIEPDRDGFACNCGPYSRESDYYRTRELAEQAFTVEGYGR